MPYSTYPAVDENHNFPQVVRQALAASAELQALAGSGDGSAPASGTMRFRDAWTSSMMVADRYDFESGSLLPGSTVISGSEWSIVQKIDSIGGTVNALKAPVTAPSTTSILSFNLDHKGTTDTPVRFRILSSSETNSDNLRVLVDGVEKGIVSGTSTEWKEVVFTGLSTGLHEWRVQYKKDGSVNIGEDTAWLSLIEMQKPNTGDPYQVGHVVTYEGNVWQLVSGLGDSTPGTDDTWVNLTDTGTPAQTFVISNTPPADTTAIWLDTSGT